MVENVDELRTLARVAHVLSAVSLDLRQLQAKLKQEGLDDTRLDVQGVLKADRADLLELENEIEATLASCSVPPVCLDCQHALRWEQQGGRQVGRWTHVQAERDSEHEGRPY